MNLLAYLDSKVWAIEERTLNLLRMKATSENLDLSKITADFEQRKADLAKAPLGAGMRTRLKTGVIQENGVAVINISGPIFNVEGYFDELIAYYFGGTSYQSLQSDIETIANDGQVKSFGVYVHSGGGEAFGMTETANKLAALTKQKPSIGYAYGLACSAAFGLISATGKIYADSSAWLGSVGVVTQWADFTGFYEKLGIAFEEVTSSNAPFKRLDIRKPEHRAVLMEEIDGVENEFVKLLAKNFGISVEKVRSDFGKGAVMTAKPAKSAGMIHETGSWANVLNELQKIARKANNTNALDAETTEGEPKMSSKKSLLEKFTSWLNSEDVEPFLNGADSDENDALNAEEKQPAGDDIAVQLKASKEREKKLQEQLDKREANAVAEKRINLVKDAETFAVAEIKAGRLYSAEKDEFVAEYVQAATDDEASPLAEGSRVECIKARQEKRVSNGFTEEQLQADLKTLPLAASEVSKLDAEVEAQASEYVAQTQPNLKVVK